MAHGTTRGHCQGQIAEPASPAEVVAWLGAVQAQDFAAAKWALGLRLRQATDAEVEKAFNDGAIQAIEQAASRYAAFLQLPMSLRLA